MHQRARGEGGRCWRRRRRGGRRRGVRGRWDRRRSGGGGGGLLVVDDFNGNDGNDRAYEQQDKAKGQFVCHGTPYETAQDFVGTTELRIKLAHRRVYVLHLLGLRVKLDSSLRAQRLQPQRYSTSRSEGAALRSPSCPRPTSRCARATPWNQPAPVSQA